MGWWGGGGGGGGLPVYPTLTAGVSCCQPWVQFLKGSENIPFRTLKVIPWACIVYICPWVIYYSNGDGTLSILGSTGNSVM